MALGLALGVVVAESGGTTTKLGVAPAAASATASASVSASAAPAAAQNAGTNADCELIVPARPLTATGLATPYQLTGPGGQDPAASGCTQANPNLQAFVQATILDPATGRLWVYEPLVITAGTRPAVAPVRPRLPKDAVVNLMFGFNGNNLKLAAANAGAHPGSGNPLGTLGGAKCVNGRGDSLFGQVAYCNSVPFYAAAGRAIAAGRLRIPQAGRSPQTGQACPTTRSFQLVDQDPSDNVTTRYLLTASGQTAQDSTANAGRLQQAATIDNGSDNTLLDSFILPALGCAAFTAADLSDASRPGTSQTLDELSAAASQRAPVALVPENDPMTMVNGAVSAPKTNLYRLGVGQPLVIGMNNEPFGDMAAGGQQADTPANFCANMINAQTAFIAANTGRFSASLSPVPAAGSNLFTFLAARLSASFTNLACQAFGLHNPVSVSLNANGVAVAATLSLVRQTPSQPQTQATPGTSATPSAQPSAVFPTPGPWNPWTPWGNGSPGNPWAGYDDAN
ncbi:MAG TPA: hypothetical protein VGS06_35055 [Streptosporangiaceae bacterium]|nr:hypothetical protein [Streptosporangiaceae bacterium]